MDTYRYHLSITGRIPAESRADAEKVVRNGLSLDLAVSDSLDTLVITVEPSEFEELSRGLKP